MLVTEENYLGAKGTTKLLDRSITSKQLIVVGIGCIVGAGLFSLSGLIAGNYAGPGVIISLLFSALACLCCAFCYAELSSKFPYAGSSYSYAHITVGTWLGFLVGWILILEYTIGCALLCLSWSSYFSILLQLFHAPINISSPWINAHTEGGYINLPASLVVFIVMFICFLGTRVSIKVNVFFVCIKLFIIISFLLLTCRFIHWDYFTPFIPPNTGVMGEFGISGILKGAGIFFVAYLGFDMITSLAQETKNPVKTLPKSIFWVIGLVSLIYLLFTIAMIGVVHYGEFKKNNLTPIDIVLTNLAGHYRVGDKVLPVIIYSKICLYVAILIGYFSGIFVTLSGQSRILLAMSNDRLLPSIFAKVHPIKHVPIYNIFMVACLVSLLAGFTTIHFMSEILSIGTLFVFAITCFMCIMERKRQSVHALESSNCYRAPLMPFVAYSGILCCLIIISFLGFFAWVRLAVWILLGIDFFVCYTLYRKIKNNNTLHHIELTQCVIKDNFLTISKVAILICLILLCLVLFYIVLSANPMNLVLRNILLFFGLLHLFVYSFFYLVKPSSIFAVKM
ncbi:MAG: amino acid permease [Phycisphaerales bacterium]|nr:amino acid permease [Phycisphaerales bacterium]